MTSPALLSTEPITGWRAELSLGFEARGTRTVLAHRRRRGPLAVQRAFYPEGTPCHVYLLHPPGGVVGGDRLDIRVKVHRGAHALVTTPGAAKFYRSAGPRAVQRQTLQVDGGASLEWLPQENILFPAANADLETEVQLRGDARFMGWELHCLGRPANAEPFSRGQARFRCNLHRDGRPLFCDRLGVGGERDLHRPAGLRGHPVVGTLLATATDRGAARTAREAGGAQVAVSCLDDLLVARYLGASTEHARQAFTAIWQALRPLLLDRPACKPRIWAT